MTKVSHPNGSSSHRETALSEPTLATRRRPIPEQSLTAIQVDDALLKLEAVRRLTGMSRSTIYSRISAGRFVQPIRLSARSIRFRAGDITTWLRAQGAQA